MSPSQFGYALLQLSRYVRSFRVRGEVHYPPNSHRDLTVLRKPLALDLEIIQAVDSNRHNLSVQVFRQQTYALHEGVHFPVARASAFRKDQNAQIVPIRIDGLYDLK